MATFSDYIVFDRKPSTVVIASSLAALLLTYFVIGAAVNYNKLRSFPGPPAAAFSRLWLFWEECNARLSHSQRAALLKYGSPARIGPNLLVTDDPELVRHMSAAGSEWRRSTWYDAMKMDSRQQNVFSTRDEKLHAALKAKEAPGYNGLDNPNLEADIDSMVLDLLALVETSYNTKIMDMASVARFFTLDVLSKIAFGRPFGFMAANADLFEYGRISAGFMLMLVLQCNHSIIYRFLSQDWIQAILAPKLTDEKGWGPLLAFAKQAVSERFGPDAKKRKDMLGSFIEKGLDQRTCEAESFLQIIAGSDSTTDVLRTTIFQLSSNPASYARLRAEIDATVAAGIANPGRVIEYTDALKLPYLRACIWESLRVSPPLFGLKSKSAPKGGQSVNGIFFPEGTDVCVCDSAFLRRPDIFGGDAEFFRPERFLDPSEQVRTARVRATECAFGSGRFMCLGRHIAYMELHKAVFELMRTFDFQHADPTQGASVVHHSVRTVSGMNLVARFRG